MMTHRKFRRLVALTGLPEAHCRGLLELLWDTAYETGDPMIGDATDVEAAARWTGRPGDLVAALLAAGGEHSCGYIDRVEGRNGVAMFAVHDLHDHAPEYVKNRWRREQNRRAAGDRFRRSQSVTDPSATDQHPLTDASVSVTPAPAPAPSAKSMSIVRADEGIPESLRTPEFLAAWDELHAYRRERRLGAWTKTTVRKRLESFAEWGPDRAVAAIRHSIENGYQGVFEPKGGGGRSRGTPKAAGACDSLAREAEDLDRRMGLVS